ncbi:potassium channel family protein [Cellulomonas hominis]|uniref:potassium channel family protein n=1 Tax=Cellulomonas hominis TaxID=156981 RepID=UPI0014441DC9|nr:potassium channel family protein [Cellulomonas hominis]NKY09579.1 two pore domain potassium channel family protein [Cellulomonas hominis]
MTAEPRPRPSRRQRLRVLLRTLATTTVLLVGYGLRPVDRPTDAVLALLAIGLVLLVLLLVWQVRSVVRSPYPVLRAVEAFVTAAVLFVVLFATGYAALSESGPEAFSEPLDRVAALYFTMTVLATVGFGDIVPVTHTARIVTTVQMVAGLAFVGLVGREFLAAVQRAHAPDPPAAPAPPDETDVTP